MPLDIVILGPPGAGKGTQARRISGELGIPHVATGDMLREAMAAGTELGLQVRPIYDRGELVPDELMVELIRERLDDADAETGFILDGFPRTIDQVEALDRMLAELDREVSIVFEFQLEEEVAVKRLMRRAAEEGRSDDTPGVVRYRFSVFCERTAPLVAHYRAQGKLLGIHADRSIDQVFAELQQALDHVAVRE